MESAIAALFCILSVYVLKKFKQKVLALWFALAGLLLVIITVYQ